MMPKMSQTVLKTQWMPMDGDIQQWNAQGENRKYPTTIREMHLNHRELSKRHCEALRHQSVAKNIGAAIVVPQDGEANNRRGSE
jgi:hypothetical protein